MFVAKVIGWVFIGGKEVSFTEDDGNFLYSTFIYKEHVNTTERVDGKLSILSHKQYGDTNIMLYSVIFNHCDFYLVECEFTHDAEIIEFLSDDTIIISTENTRSCNRYLGDVFGSFL